MQSFYITHCFNTLPHIGWAESRLCLWMLSNMFSHPVFAAPHAEAEKLNILTREWETKAFLRRQCARRKSSIDGERNWVYEKFSCKRLNVLFSMWSTSREHKWFAFLERIRKKYPSDKIGEYRKNKPKFHNWFCSLHLMSFSVCSGLGLDCYGLVSA